MCVGAFDFMGLWMRYIQVQVWGCMGRSVNMKHRTSAVIASEIVVRIGFDLLS